MWELIGAVAGVMSLAFAVFVFVRSQKNRITETAKNAIYSERLRNIHYSLMGILHSTDAIVQIGKQDGIEVQTLQDIARVTRGQMYMLVKQIEKERGLMKEWKYGHMIESSGEIEIDELGIFLET